jgi:hypothetical protein
MMFFPIGGHSLISQRYFRPQSTNCRTAAFCLLFPISGPVTRGLQLMPHQFPQRTSA